MNCTIKINMDNSAFDDNPEYELSRILRTIAHRIEHNPIQYIPNEKNIPQKFGTFITRHKRQQNW